MLTAIDTRAFVDEDDDQGAFDLTSAYTLLSGHLWKAKGVRQFCLMSETMEMMLRAKVGTCLEISMNELT